MEEQTDPLVGSSGEIKERQHDPGNAGRVHGHDQEPAGQDQGRRRLRRRNAIRWTSKERDSQDQEPGDVRPRLRSDGLRGADDPQRTIWMGHLLDPQAQPKEAKAQTHRSAGSSSGSRRV